MTRAMPSRRRGPATRAADLPSSALLSIWDAVCRVPPGRVATYGGIARAAGFPGRARQAGYALKVAPPAMHLPWHRVVGAGGRIAFPEGSPAHREQSRLLEAEGIPVRNGRVPPAMITELDAG